MDELCLFVFVLVARMATIRVEVVNNLARGKQEQALRILNN